MPNNPKTPADETRIVTAEIERERDYQRTKWGNDADNDLNTPNDFVAYLTAQATKWHPGGFAPYGEETIAAFRRAMIKTAAVAVAGAEYADRILGLEIDRPDVAVFTKKMLMPPVFDAAKFADNDIVFSTVRVGNKWLNALSPGEDIKLISREGGASIATATVVDIEQGLWADVRDTTINNFATYGDSSGPAKDVLRQAVIDAYGLDPKTFDDEVLTVIHMQIKKEG